MSPPSEDAGRSGWIALWPWIAGLALVGLLGVVLVLRFVEAERERELRAWQVRLGIVADSRFAAVDGWLADQLAEMTALAENASVQIYMSAVLETGYDPARLVEVEPQTEYLRNLLLVTADRTGFAVPQGPTVGANVSRVGVAGLALVDLDGRPLAATPGMAPVEGSVAAFLAGIERGRRGILDLFANQAGEPSMGFAAPVYAVQGDRDPSAQIGWVLGVKEVAGELYPLLLQPGATEGTAESLLVRGAGNLVEYLSTLKNGAPPLSLRLARDTPDLEAAFALDQPGGFGLKRDYRDREVLMTSRAFTTAPWTLVHKVDRAEALGESEARLARLLAFLLLGIALAAVLIVAFWRHGSSRRAAAAAQLFRTMAERLERQRNLLRIVTDSQPTSIFILDRENRYTFANRQSAAAAGVPADEMIGKPIDHVCGPEAARRRLHLAGRIRDERRAITDVGRVEADGGVRVLQTESVPLEGVEEAPGGVLFIEHDVSEAVNERERRSRILGQLVRTLVGVVDRRDPFAAGHSQRVGRLARAVATEMGLDEGQAETAEIAGSLLNLGKIFVPATLLTRSTGLSEAERQQIREGMQTSADLLEGVEFDGPVVETLRQAQAHWDGTGIPPGLAGEDIIVTARIVAVANAFVGMVSHRAHREALGVDRAIEALLAGMGRAYDRRVVAALVNYLDNRGGRAQWAELEPQAEAG